MAGIESGVDVEWLVNALSLEESSNLDDVLEAASRCRGKPVVLRPSGVPVTAACALPVVTAEGDYLEVPPAPLTRRVELLVLHQLAHVLLGHAEVRAAETAVLLHEQVVLCQLLPTLSAALVRRVLERGAYLPDQEREADEFVGLVLIHTRGLG